MRAVLGPPHEVDHAAFFDNPDPFEIDAIIAPPPFQAFAIEE